MHHYYYVNLVKVIKMHRIITILFFLISIKFTVFGQTNVNYTTNTTDIANPSRGFYKHYETTINTTNASPALNQTDIENLRTDSNITIILRLYYLGAYRTSNISAAYLTGIQNDLNVIRNSGAKAIIRFAYNNTSQTHRHTNDASLAQVLIHLGQLKNVLRNNADVILAVQNGFVGTWGEWYYTHADFTNASPAGSPNYANRKQVSDSLLKILDPRTQVQIRVAAYKYNASMYGNGSSGVSNALNATEAYTGIAKARMAHHNDCFLAAADDWGTYLSSPMSLDKDYIEQETKYLINGGETCNDDATYTNCTNAQAELAKLRYTYLNIGYNATVLNRWRSNNCFTAIKRKLGYRYELSNGSFTTTASASFNFNVKFNLTNVGYAPIYEKKSFVLILKNTVTSTLYNITIDSVDVRKWLPNMVYSFDKNVGIGGIPNGTYNLLLQIKDSTISLSNNGRYNIRFANTGTWDATENANILRSGIIVNNAVNPGSGLYTGTEWFGPLMTLATEIENFNGVKNNAITTLSWEISESNEVLKYEIEQSYNTSNFIKVGTILSLNQGFSKYTIDVKDNDLYKINYYRIKIILKNGTYKYSKIIKLVSSKEFSHHLHVFPQPANNHIQIEIINATQGIGVIEILNMHGKRLSQKQVSINNAYTLLHENISALQSGIYLVKTKINNNTVITKFVKN
jgi:hypothetical protein